MQISEQRRTARTRRRARVRASVQGTDRRPRLSVFRSNKYIYLQVISDESGRTLAAVSTLGSPKGLSLESAKALGAEIARKCKDLSIESLVFDRSGYRYHGRVKTIAESVREAGIGV